MNMMKLSALIVLLTLLLCGCANTPARNSDEANSSIPDATTIVTEAAGTGQSQDNIKASSTTPTSPSTEPAPEEALPLATNLTDTQIIDQVCGLLQEAGLSNVEHFQAILKDYAQTVGAEAKLESAWVAADSMSTDYYDCIERWEQVKDHSDLNCRLTATLLLQDLFTVEKTVDNYDGSYLMFDLDSLDTVADYDFLRPARNLLLSVFGEIDVAGVEKDQLANALANHWNDCGIRLESEKASLVSVFMHDKDFELMFVGHTGVLLDCGTHYLFIEKIAFEAPYQLTKLDSIDQLKSLLSQRPDYFSMDGGEGPFLYINDRLLEKLEAEN